MKNMGGHQVVRLIQIYGCDKKTWTINIWTFDIQNENISLIFGFVAERSVEFTTAGVEF